MTDYNPRVEPFSSEDSFDEDDCSDSSTDIDEKVKQDDVFDLEFLKCYSALKKKDSKIYDKNVKFFSEEVSSDEENDNGESKDNQDHVANKKASKPRLTLLDQQLGLRDDEIEELPSDKSKIDLNAPVAKSYYEKELEEIKKKISETIDSDSDDDLFVVKSTGSSAKPSNSKQAINSLISKIEDEDNADLSHLMHMWKNPDNLSEEDRFLRDYIINKRYVSTNNDEGDQEEHKKVGDFFSKNIDELSDISSDDEGKIETKKTEISYHSEEKAFDEIARIPRNATKTIRDLAEKRSKKEKRLKKLEKQKKKKKSLKDADYEDVVGDIHTKFHYRETEPNDYGLSPEELLSATDEELDKWIGLIDAIKYRSEDEEKALKNKFDRKRNDLALKKEIFKSIYGEQAEQPSGTEESNKKKRKRTSSNDPSDVITKVGEDNFKTEQAEDESSKKKKKKRKRGTNHKKFAKVGVAPDRLLAYGISKTKLKKFKLL